MKKVLLSNDEIVEICKRIAKEIKEKVKDDERVPVLVGVMKGSLNFMLELIKHLDIPIYTDYIQISSYEGVNRNNNVRLLKDVSFDCSDRSVIIVEDIVDTGHSMSFLIDHIKRHHAKNVYVCTLVNKELARQVEVTIDFCGYVMKDKKFIAGFGLDYYELERNVPFIYEVDEEELAKLDKIVRADKEFNID